MFHKVARKVDDLLLTAEHRVQRVVEEVGYGGGAGQRCQRPAALALPGSRVMSATSSVSMSG
jgi:hypothetical protein